MSSTREFAEVYLQSEHESFWEWVDHGEAVRWRDGPTIAIRQELPLVLESLADNGLPPFNMVLLLLSACRSEWNDAGDEILQRLTLAHPQFARRGGGRMWLEAAVRALERVNALPADSKSTTAARVAVCETVFERHPDRLKPDVSRAVIELLQSQRLPERVLTQHCDPPSISVRTQGLMALCDAVQRVDATSLELRQKTGLDQLPREPAVIEEESPEPERLTVRQLLTVMEDDHELAGLAKLTRNLQAIVHLPRQVNEPEELPLGGVSDITNRGPFDRLLLSELANDSDTLMTRVALGEALYLRREKPPSNPPRQRIVLLDSGIRMWGVPRIFACGVALSLMADAEGQDTTSVFRADGDIAQPVDFGSRDGLVDHLTVLDPHTHPGEALPSLLTKADDEPFDLVIVSCPQALADRQFRRQLREAQIEGCYLASVTREGDFQLIAHSSRGERILKQATLDLNTLLAERTRPSTPLIDASRLHPLPAIFRLEQFPLRLSHRHDGATMWSSDGETALVVTDDRRLMQWSSPDHGAVQLIDQLPGRIVRWRGKLRGWDPDASHFIVEHLAENSLSLVAVDVQQGNSTITPLQLSLNGLQGMAPYAGLLLAIYRNRAFAINPVDGCVTAESQLHAQLNWRYGRYFRGDGGWFCLAMQGSQLTAESILSAKRPQDYDIVFFCEAAQEHVAVSNNGYLVLLDTDERRRIPPPPNGQLVKVTEVAEDGNWMMVEWRVSEHYTHHIGYDVPTLTTQGPYARSQPLHMVKQTNLRTQISAMGIVDGRLSLVTDRNRRYEFVFLPHNPRIVLRRGDSDDRDVTLRRTMLKTSAPDGVGYRLKVAEWEDGSRAYIDSRGLLHLISSDRSIPEATFVLADGHVSGWVSDGRLFGAKFYTGETQRSRLATPKEVYDAVISPFVQQIVSSSSRKMIVCPAEPMQ